MVLPYHRSSLKTDLTSDFTAVNSVFTGNDHCQHRRAMHRLESWYLASQDQILRAIICFHLAQFATCLTAQCGRLFFADHARTGQPN